MKNRLFTTLSVLLFSCFLSAQGPQNWNPNKSYTHPALVINGSTTYLSLRDVPSYTSITDMGYWSTLDSMVPTDTPTGSDSLKTPDASELESLTIPYGNTENTDNDRKKLLVVGYNYELQKNQIHMMDSDGLNSELLASFDFPSGFWAPDNSLLHGDSLLLKDSSSGWLVFNLKTKQFNENLELPDLSSDVQKVISVDEGLLVVGYNYELQKNQIHMMDSDGLNSELLASFDFPSGFWAPDNSLLHGDSLLLKDSSSGWLVFNLKTKQFNENLELPDLSSDVQKVISVDDTEDLPPSPPSTDPGTPPADDYLETIAALQKQIEQLTAELNDAKEEISKKDETIAELQSTNLELSYENDELRGELAEEVEKNDVLTAQVANITQDNNNLKYDLGVATKQAEEAVKMAQVPFINGWVYDNDRGWIFTDADHYPMVYTHKTNTWHYYELGSNPRFFFNFTSQQWEAWDDLSEENDSNLADSNNF